MYKNLITEMLVNGITYKNIATTINKHRETVKKKLFENNTCFDLNEAKLIHNTFFSSLNFAYLFESTKKEDSAIRPRTTESSSNEI